MNSLVYILFSMIVMVGVGSFQNTMVTDGYSANVSLTCPGWPDVTCQNTANVGCQSAPAQCTLSGTSISFLNGNSPFTCLIQGNLACLTTGLTNNPSTSSSQPSWLTSPFGPLGGGNYFTANCGETGGGKTIRVWIIDGCTQTSGFGNQNLSKADAVRLNNWNTGASQSAISVASPFFNLSFGPNGTGFNFNCALVGQGTAPTGFGSTNTTNTAAGFTIFGCDLYKGANPNIAGDPWFSTLISIPNTAAQSIGAGYQHISVYMMPEPWETYFCGLVGYTPSLYLPYSSSQCLNFFQTLNQQSALGGGNNTFNFSFITPLVLFAIGVVLLIIGIGLQFGWGGSIFGSGTNFSFGTNAQATRFAQALGVGLLIFAPLYSEFGGWFTPGSTLDILPNGLDFFILIVVFGLFVFGTYGVAISGMTGGDKGS